MYQDVIDILKKKFGSYNMRYQMVYTKLKNLPLAKEDRNSLRTTVEAIEQILLQLESFQHGND